MGNDRPQYHRNREGDTKADADKRHRFGTVLPAGEVRQERHDGGGTALTLVALAPEYAPD